jgi:ankyrin repeat/BTB/POZ domain-containing protein 1
MVLRKNEIEAALFAENEAISAGRLREDNPLDLTDDFRLFCEACRKGDLKVCQEKITEGVNINARDTFDYTPLILVSALWTIGALYNRPRHSAQC